MVASLGHSQPVGSDHSICPQNHDTMLLPGSPTQPLSTVRPFIGQAPNPTGVLFLGDWDILFVASWNYCQNQEQWE